MNPPADPQIVALQQRVQDWTFSNINVMAEECVARINASAGDAGRVKFEVTLTDGTFVCVSCLCPPDDTTLDLALREAVRQTTIMRGIAPAMNGVNLEAISPEEMAARIEHYLVANPLIRWQRTRDYADGYLQALHLRTVGKLSLVGARWVRLEEDSAGRAVHGLLCASPDGDSVFYLGAVFHGRAQVEAGGGAGYKLKLVCEPTAPDALKARLIEASQTPAPARGLEEAVARIEAMVDVVVSYYGSRAQSDGCPDRE